MGLILGPNRFIAKDVKSCTYGVTLTEWVGKCLTQYHAELGLPDKGRAINGLVVVCNDCDIEPLDLLNGLALGCYQPSPD